MPQIDTLATPPSLAKTAGPRRRFDLDALRIAAFGLLILYHVGMVYVTWGFHVKSPHASTAIEPAMLLINPWRLELLFLISGVATRFMLDKAPAVKVARARLSRLGWPILIGVLVIVPPQTYVEVVQKLGFTGGYLDFYGKYLSGYGGWTIDGERLVVPTYNHLWFVVYALIYTLVIAAVWPLLRRLKGLHIGAVASAAAAVIGPWLFLWAMRSLLFPHYPVTHALINDWYAHANYFGMFVLGVAIAKQDAVFELAKTIRWPALAVALAAYWGWQTLAPSGAQLSEWQITAARAAREALAWGAILAALGFARRHWDHDGPIRRYLTKAVLPYYILHQTFIILAVFWLAPLGLPPWAEAAAVIASTILGCIIGYELIRRVGALRRAFGVSDEPRQA